MKISESDREYLDLLKKTRPLALIICFSKHIMENLVFVNELLNESLLPESSIIDKNEAVRMVRIKVEVRLRFIYFYFLIRNSDLYFWKQQKKKNYH